MANEFECYECGQIFKTKDERKKHGMTSGHQWLYILPSKKGSGSSLAPVTPSSSDGVAGPSQFLTCSACSVAFYSLESFNSHNSAVHRGNALPPKLNNDKLIQGHTTMLNDRFPLCPICRCRYQDKDVLLKHMQTYTNCDLCNVHLLPSWSLEAHYATSDPHPKCEKCGFGFKDDEAYHSHLYDCFRDLHLQDERDPQPASSSSSMQEGPSPEIIGATRSLSSIPQQGPVRPLSSLAKIGERSEPEQIATPPDLDGPSLPIAADVENPPTAAPETQLPVPEAPSVGEEVCESHGSKPDGRSSDNEQTSHSRAHITENPTLFTYDSETAKWVQKQQSEQELSQVDEPRGLPAPDDTAHKNNAVRQAAEYSSRSSTFPSTPSSISVSAPSGASTRRISSSSVPSMFGGEPANNGHTDEGVDMGTQRTVMTGTNRRESGQDTHARPEQSGAPTSSWHCRICLNDPCHQPVVTMCGHMFCSSCIMNELASRPCCPVCSKIFFVRLMM